MESKCAWSNAAWSGGAGGEKCLGNYLDHLMLLRVALSATTAAETGRSATSAISSAVAADACPSRQRRQHQRQSSPPQPLAELAERSPTVCSASATAAATDEQTLRSQQQLLVGRLDDEPIYYELEPHSSFAAESRPEQRSQPDPAAIARLALERLSALAERGVFDAASAASPPSVTTTATATTSLPLSSSSACALSSAQPTDGRPATVPRAARPHVPQTRRVGGRICVADALALAGDYERAAAVSCGLLDLCGPSAARDADDEAQLRLRRRPASGRPPVACDAAAELSLLAAECEPVYERIACAGGAGGGADDEDDVEAGDFDSVQHSSCGRRGRGSAAATTAAAAAAPEPPQLPPPRARTCPRTAPIKSESDACGGDDKPSPSSDGCGVESAKKRASCPELPGVCRIRMGVAAKKAWEERYLRRPVRLQQQQQQQLPQVSDEYEAAQARTVPAFVAAEALRFTDYKVLPVVYC